MSSRAVPVGIAGALPAAPQPFRRRRVLRLVPLSRPQFPLPEGERVGVRGRFPLPQAMRPSHLAAGPKAAIIGCYQSCIRGLGHAETNMAAQGPAPPARPRISDSNEHPGRARSDQGPARQGPEARHSLALASIRLLHMHHGPAHKCRRGFGCGTETAFGPSERMAASCSTLCLSSHGCQMAWNTAALASPWAGA